jgi:hypothetical protein
MISEIDNILDNYNRFLQKAGKNLMRMYYDIIIYNRDKMMYQALDGAYPNLYIKQSHDNTMWERLTDTLIVNGFDPNFCYADYCNIFNNVMESTRIKLIKSALKDPTPREIVDILARLVNKKTNFPIFAWSKKKNLHLDKSRWLKIEESIMKRLNMDHDKLKFVIYEFRRLLCNMLYEMREVNEAVERHVIFIETHNLCEEQFYNMWR